MKYFVVSGLFQSFLHFQLRLMLHFFLLDIFLLWCMRGKFRFFFFSINILSFFIAVVTKINKKCVTLCNILILLVMKYIVWIFKHFSESDRKFIQQISEMLEEFPHMFWRTWRRRKSTNYSPLQLTHEYFSWYDPNRPCVCTHQQTSRVV